MATTSYHRSTDQNEAVSPPQYSAFFPVHGEIAKKTIIGVSLIYILFNLARIAWLSFADMATALACVASNLAIIIAFQWMLYRLLILARGGAAPQAIVLLTLPTLALAIGAAYCHSLTMESVGVAAGRMDTFDLLFTHYLILAGGGGVFLALVQGKTTHHAIAKSATMGRLKRDSERRALRFQLNPHFVFNALNSVSSLVIDQQNQKAEQLIDGLADYMHGVLDDEGEDIVSVRQEIAQHIRYLNIEKVRFPDRLNVETLVDGDVTDWKVPAWIMQPLIENAIKYGVARSIGSVCIRISASTDNDRLRLSVANSCDGINGAAPIPGTGTGLNNVKNRLAAIYGPSALLLDREYRDDMVEVTMFIPNETFILGDE